MNTFSKPALIVSPLVLAITVSVYAETTELDAVTVTADFRQTSVQTIPEAVTVVGKEQIESRSAVHLESVLSLTPNVNFSSGGSRARYYQIRGIGERSQFIDPVNPSVGLMIDGIDMTGLGGAATLLDVDQIEILRGPQGTRFGANALAGMINIRSAAAMDELQGYVKGQLGNYGTHGQSGAITGGLTDKVKGRLAVSSFKTNGYMDNDYLNRDNTNNIDEVVARGKLHWHPDSQSELQLTYLRVDVDNGYDAFTLDNSRQSLADSPGRDSQDTDAVSVAYNTMISNSLLLETNAASSWNKTEYSYDEDWVSNSYPPKWGTAFDAYLRDEQRDSLEVRLLSGIDSRIFGNTTDWVTGIYWMERDQKLKRNHTGKVQYQNDLSVKSLSAYAEFNSVLTQTTSLVYGIRTEKWKNNFSANDGISGETSEQLFGGKITVEQLLLNNHLGYVSLARGYKPGGVNSDNDVSNDNRTFDTERNNTVELGIKSSLDNDALQTRVAVFYIHRKNQQVKSSYFDRRSNKFQDYLSNAAEGRNYGLEVESHWQLSSDFLWELSYGYLSTEFKDYEYEKNVYDASWNVVASKTINKSGRSQAHAPEYSVATALHYSPVSTLTLSIESEAKDAFYFSDSHDEKSHSYVLWHAQAKFESGPYVLSVYGRNLTDKETNVRGFGGFNNDSKSSQPDDQGRYVQLGEPRLLGIEGKYSF